MSETGGEGGGLDVILKIIKSLHWNEVFFLLLLSYDILAHLFKKGILIRCTRILSNIAAVKENIDYLMKRDVPYILGNILKNLLKPNDKIINNVRKFKQLFLKTTRLFL